MTKGDGDMEVMMVVTRNMFRDWEQETRLAPRMNSKPVSAEYWSNISLQHQA